MEAVAAAKLFVVDLGPLSLGYLKLPLLYTVVAGCEEKESRNNKRAGPPASAAQA